MGNLRALIGLPRSGKSTFASKWVCSSELDSMKDWWNYIKVPRVIVSGDEIRKALHGDEYHWQSEDFVWAIQNVMIRSLLNSGHDVLVDETNTSERNIRNLLKIDPRCKFNFIDTSFEVCMFRAEELEQTNLIPVIERCHTNLQKLTGETYYTEHSVMEAIRRIKDEMENK